MLPAQELRQRLERGLMTLPQYNKECQRRARNQSIAGTENLKMRFIPSWERPEKSARIALKLLRAYPFDTPEKMEWSVRVTALVREAIEEMNKSKTTYKLPEGRLLFWYDVVNGMSHKLRAAVNDYPDGPDKSPRKVM